MGAMFPMVHASDHDLTPVSNAPDASVQSALVIGVMEPGRPHLRRPNFGVKVSTYLSGGRSGDQDVFAHSVAVTIAAVYRT